MEIKVKSGGRKAAPVSFNVNVPTDLKGLVAAFGEQIIAVRAHQKLVIEVQDFARRNLKAGKKPDEIAKELANWKPGTKAPGQSKAQKAESLLAGLTDAERLALLAKFGIKK